jgi:hypothetical protein
MKISHFLPSLFHNLRIGATNKNEPGKRSKSSLFRNDTDFDHLYPRHVQKLSEMHWTPLHIVKKASEFLAVPDAKILDIGSGVGKFCLAAGFFQPKSLFDGIEQRSELFSYAETVKQEMNLPNVNFMHGNFTELDFNDFDHFYFYNSFYENITPTSPIDYILKTSYELYEKYSMFLFNMLEEKPEGTRLVTFQAPGKQIPASYRLIDNSYRRELKMWMKG